MCAIRIPVYERSVQLDAAAQTMPRFRANDSIGKGLKDVGGALTELSGKLEAKKNQFENFQAAQVWGRAQDATKLVYAEEAERFNPLTDEPGTMHNRIAARVKPIYDAALKQIPERLAPQYQERYTTELDKHSTAAAIGENTISDRAVTSYLDKRFGGIAAGLKENPKGFDAAFKAVSDEVNATTLPASKKSIMIQGYARQFFDASVDGFKKTKDISGGQEFVKRVAPQMDQMERDRYTPGPRSDAGGSVIEAQGKEAKIRRGAIGEELKGQLAYAAEQAGVRVKVYSGGQPSHGVRGVDRTGGHRHDNTGKGGGAADVQLYVNENGKDRLLDSSNPKDAAVMKTFVTAAVQAGATGVGHGSGYMGNDRIHVGGGNPASWGGSPWIEQARRDGVNTRSEFTARKGNTQTASTDPSFNPSAKPQTDRFMPEDGAQPANPMAASTAATGGKDLTQGRSMQAFQFFVDKGLTPAQAAGLVGNLRQEGDTLDASKSHDNNRGIGLSGWNGERRAALKAFTGGDEANFDKQLEFMWHELNTTEKRAMARIKAADNPVDAAQAAQTYFRPGIPRTESRIQYAKEVFTDAVKASAAPAQQTEAAPQKNVQVADASGRVQIPAGNEGKPIIANADGSFSTERTITIEAQGAHYVIPTIVDGKQLSNEDAIKSWKEGKSQHVGGEFNTAAEADAYARQRSEQIGQSRGGEARMGVNLTPQAAPAAAPAPLTFWQQRANNAMAEFDNETTRLASKDRSMKRLLVQSLEADAASIQGTGKPLKLPKDMAEHFGTDVLSPALVEKVLGEAEAWKWDENRNTALRVFGETEGIKTGTLPMSEMYERLSRLEPQPGAFDYPRQVKIYNGTATEIEKIRKERDSDPAAAADKTPPVREALIKVQREPTPENMAALIKARMDMQKLLEVPEADRQALTKRQAQNLAAPFTDKTVSLTGVPGLARTLIDTAKTWAGGDEQITRNILRTVLKEGHVDPDRTNSLATELSRPTSGYDNGKPVKPAAQPSDGWLKRAITFGAPKPAQEGAPPADTYVEPSAIDKMSQLKNDDGAFVPGGPNTGIINPDDVSGLRSGKLDPAEFTSRYGVGSVEHFINKPGATGTYQPPPQDPVKPYDEPGIPTGIGDE